MCYDYRDYRREEEVRKTLQEEADRQRRKAKAESPTEERATANEPQELVRS